MDCRLDESTGESSAENPRISGNDIAATDKSGKCQTTQGNANGADNATGDKKLVPPVTELNNSQKLGCKEKDSGLPSEENPSGSRTVDESEDSDFVVQDVKVCDICGDAGREDLLAICIRCSDGAEHTYCMRDMLDTVPEGDWMCEECRYEEEMKNQKKLKVVNIEGNGKTSSGKVSGGNSNARLKSDTRSGNDLDITSNDRSNMKILGKRPKEDAEVSSLSKRQAVESVIGSQNISGSKVVASLVDRGKEKLAHQSSSGTPAGSDDTDSARALVKSPRRLTPRGSFLKSNSFNSFNAKPKVKIEDEAVSLKQKSLREPPPLGKSMSFRTMGSGRYGNGESKVKMLSPNFSHNQDSIGFKHTRERSALERKSSFKSERPVISSPRVGYSTSNFKDEKKLGCRDETALSSVQSDCKASSLSKIPSLASRGPSRDGKRQLLVATGFGGAEQKVNNNEQSLTSGNASIDETIRGSGNQDCPVDALPDVVISKSSREVANGTNDLKAAIEAAMLRKPSICRKPRVSDRSNDSSQPHDHFVGPVSKKNVPSGMGKDVFTAARNSTNFGIHASLDNVGTSSTRTGDLGLVVPCHGTRDLPYQLPSPISVWKTSAIPELEFTWQGNFEVHKNEKLEFYDGVQAHLSACASPRVLSVVDKFPHKVVLNEAPRPSIWPLQFHEYGVKEDNVALYFFAKDVDSYEKSYKILLENMIKNDLALKGIIDGVELLIFPSMQLPQQSQRWNMLYFLWGVFRGKKTSQSNQQDNRPATVSLNSSGTNASLVAEMTVPKDGVDVSEVPYLVQVKENDKINVEMQGSILGSNALTSLQKEGEVFRVPSKIASFQVLTHHVSHEANIGDVVSREIPLLNDLNCKLPLDDGKIISEATSTSSSQAIQIDDDDDNDDVIVLGSHRRQKICSDGSNVSNDQSSSSNDDISMRARDVASGSSLIVGGESFVEKMAAPKWAKAERFFFPVDPAHVNRMDVADLDLALENKVHVESPNLDLALGGETGLSAPGIPSFLTDKKVMEDGRMKKQAPNEEEDLSGPLSLSLGFPFSDNEQDHISISKAGQVTERAQVNPPFLFGGIKDK